MSNKSNWILILLISPLIIIGYQNCSSGLESSVYEAVNKSSIGSVSDSTSDLEDVSKAPDLEELPDLQMLPPKLLNCNMTLSSSSAEFSWEDPEQTDLTIYDFLLGSSENQKDIYDHIGNNQFNKKKLIVHNLPKDGRRVYQTLLVFRQGPSSAPIKVSCTFKAFSDITEVEGANDDRLTFWKNKGYSLYWESTPKIEHLGKNHQEYFRKDWSNGHKIASYGIDAGYQDTLTIARAPDNSISAKVRIRKGEEKGVNIKGMQFGDEGPEKSTLWSLKWYNPCDGGQTQNNKSGTYVGFGHVWGAIKGSTRSPGGSRREVGAWSIRVPLGVNNTFFAYAYIPDRPNASGQSWSSNISPVCDKWMLTELEIVQNKPASSKNGILRLYIDKVLAREVRGIRIRDFDTVKPRGFGFFVRHNSGAPKDEVFYFKEWKIFTK